MLFRSFLAGREDQKPVERRRDGPLGLAAGPRAEHDLSAPARREEEDGVEAPVPPRPREDVEVEVRTQAHPVEVLVRGATVAVAGVEQARDARQRLQPGEKRPARRERVEAAEGGPERGEIGIRRLSGPAEGVAEADRVVGGEFRDESAREAPLQEIVEDEVRKRLGRRESFVTSLTSASAMSIRRPTPARKRSSYAIIWMFIQMSMSPIS